jgi:2-iminobutanoate/2-iminopropanoate deaminase
MEHSTTPDVAYLTAPEMAGLPFSEAVRVGNLLFLSGQLGRDATGRVVPGGIAAETRQTMENIQAALARHGSSLDRMWSRRRCSWPT